MYDVFWRHEASSLAGVKILKSIQKELKEACGIIKCRHKWESQMEPLANSPMAA
jgi:hypothetical protein